MVPVEGARGNYALRIGNAENATNVKLQCDVYFDTEAVYEWNEYVKSQGTLNAGSQISITNMANNDGKAYLLTDVAGLENGWKFLQDSDEVGANPKDKTKVWGSVNGETKLGHIQM